MHYINLISRLWFKYSLPSFIVMQLFWLLPLSGDGPIWNVGMSLLVPACKDATSLMSTFGYFSNYRIKHQENVFNLDLRFTVVSSLGESLRNLEVTRLPFPSTSAIHQLGSCPPSFSCKSWVPSSSTLSTPHHAGACWSMWAWSFRAATWAYRPTTCGARQACSTVSTSVHWRRWPRRSWPSIWVSWLKLSGRLLHRSNIDFYHSGINQYVISFFIGIITGYLINQQLIHRKYCLSPRTVTLIWMVSSTSLVSVMIWFNTLHTINQTPSRLSWLLWFSVGKLIGCLSIAWMLYALCVGKAGRIWVIWNLVFEGLIRCLHSSHWKSVLLELLSHSVATFVWHLLAAFHTHVASTVHRSRHLCHDGQVDGKSWGFLAKFNVQGKLEN